MRSVNLLVPRRLSALVGRTAPRRRRGLMASVVVGIGLSGLAGEVPASSAQAKAITLVLPDGTQMPLPVLTGRSPARPAAPARAPGSTSPATASPPVASAPTASRRTPAATPARGPTGGRAPLSILSMPAQAPASVPPPVIAGATAQDITGKETGPPAAPGGAPFGTPATRGAPVAPAAAAVGPAPVIQPTTGMRAPDGHPTAADPTLSIGLPAPVPVGVPNFFVDHFDVPPFLLPIFRAAGARYQVPWQVLAAINQIETDYGRNLGVSTAGATGWMQILPQTWRAYGVDASGTGIKDPYNPADAIFAAARILHAAGASENLKRAIFAYNHAGWYVDSVMLRARLIGGLPPELAGSIAGLADGVFPIHAAVRYADDVAEAAALATRSAPRWAASGAGQSTKTSAIRIYAASGSPVLAVKAGLITAIGSSVTRGRYVHLRDAYGNTYVYSQLGRLAKDFATTGPLPAGQPGGSSPLTRAALSAGDPIMPHDAPPQGPASAGHQTVAATVPGLQNAAAAPPAGPVATDTVAGPQRLFAHPTLPSSFAAGGRAQVASGSPDLSRYTSNPDGLSPDGVVLAPLAAGAHVLAGAILGQIGPRSQAQASHISFQLRPPGRNSPYVDPKAILDGWQLLQATANQPAAGGAAPGRSALFGPARAAALDAIGWETAAALTAQVLGNRSIVLHAEVRRAIRAGSLDQPALAALEFLAASGLKPTVSGVRTVADPTAILPTNIGPTSVAAPFAGLDISAINGVPVLGHNGSGSIADIAIRQLLGLPTGLRPLEINNQLSYSSDGSAASDRADRITLTFAPVRPVFGRLGDVGLTPPQWLSLIDHLNGLNNPTVANGQSGAGALPGP